MAVTNFGGLPLGEVRGSTPDENVNGIDQFTQRDLWVFRTGNVRAGVHLTIRPDGAPTVQGADVDLKLFRDANENQIIDSNDPRVGLSFGSESSESIDVVLRRGQYIALVDSITPLSGFQQEIPYIFRVARDKDGAANPLAGQEIPLGQISQDLQRRNRINDSDTADNFAFTLDGNSNLNIGVRERGNKKGDVNIRIVQDLNGNGIVDGNEVIVKGTSTNQGNTDTITGLTGAGDYILQVCQSKGATRFEVNFDHVAG